jgi:uncharacterized protein (TIRG00374 family)
MEPETPYSISKEQKGNKRSSIFRRIYIRLFGIVLLSILLYFTDFKSILSIVVSLNISFLVIAMAIVLTVIFIRGIRWGLLLRANGIFCPILKVLQANYFSVFLSMLTPGRVGELGKAFLLGTREPSGLAMIIGTVIVDRFLDISVVTILGLISATILCINYNINISGLVLWFAIGFIIIAAIVIAFRISIFAQFAMRLTNIIGLKNLEVAKTFQESVKLFIRTLPTSFFLTLLSWALQSVMAHFIALAIGLYFTPITLVFFVATSTLISLLPISFGGIGTRDGVFILVFSKMGYPPEAAISYAMCFLCVNFFLAIFGWLFWVAVDLKN